MKEEVETVYFEKEEAILLWQQACQEKNEMEAHNFFEIFVWNHSIDDLERIFDSFPNKNILAKYMKYTIEQGILYEAVLRDDNKTCTKEKFLELARKDKECREEILKAIAKETNDEDIQKLFEVYDNSDIEYIEDIMEFEELEKEEEDFVNICEWYAGMNKYENDHACILLDDLFAFVFNNFELENCFKLILTPMAKQKFEPIIDFWAYGGITALVDGKYVVTSEHPFDK